MDLYDTPIIKLRDLRYIRGMFVAFEVKTDSGRLTKLQEATIQKIKDAKGKAYKVTSVEEVKKILDNLED